MTESPNRERAALFGVAIGDIDLVGAFEEMDEYLAVPGQFAASLIQSYAADIRAFPECRELMKHPWLDREEEERDNVQTALVNAIYQHKGALEVIAGHHAQLEEYFPRCRR